MKYVHIKYVQKLLTILFFISPLIHLENIYTRYYSYSSSYYASWEVFDMVDRNDVYGIESWLRTYPRTVDIRNSRGQTPFMVAVRLQHYTIANKLLRAGANRYARDDFGRLACDYMYDRDFQYTISYSSSSDANSILAALGVGAVAGLAAYALSDSNVSVSYNSDYDGYNYNYSSDYDRYCPGCGVTRYSGESLYCGRCR